jgi:hypothetical protein
MRRPLTLLLLASVAAGCVGEIGDRRSSSGAGDVPPPHNGAGGPQDVGRVTMHRLNRAEYNNTVRDLLGTTQTPADDFPADDYGYGFDNVADVLSISPSQLELYDRAAEALVDEVFAGPLKDDIVTCDAEALGASCVRTILGDFATRAWRRPVTEAEVDDLVSLVDFATAAGKTTDESLQQAIWATLLSPKFIFRVEIDPDPESVEAHPLSDYELASRLSYFVWSSMPDEELFAAAEAGLLADEAELEKQVARMLEDDKAVALVDNFAGQWLQTRSLVDHQPDYASFPTFDDELRASMEAETKAFFRSFLSSDIGIDALLVADFTFVNDRLAEHYGLPSPGSNALEKVQLTSDQRGGLLTQAGVLTVTSLPTRTSPVKRGKWILAQLLCSEPPPPPEGVEGFNEEALTVGTIREQLEAHRANPECAACHAIMDPLGFGLEKYDGVGSWRTEDNDQPIDATGELPTGEEFDGAAEMADLLAGDPRFGQCVAEQLFVYALGRGVEKGDKFHLESIDSGFGERGYRLRELIKLIVVSEPFRMRRGEPVEEES